MSEALYKCSVCDSDKAPGHYGMLSTTSCWKRMHLEGDGTISASLLLKDIKVPFEVSQVSQADGH